MASPFPGMDPYLESDEFWSLFQHQLVMCLYHLLLPGLVDRYRARVGQRQYASEQALFTSVVREQHEEEYIEVRHRGHGRLVTLVDVVSPANKRTTQGRQAYLLKRQEARFAGSNLVEIDLVLQGQPTLDYTRPDCDYAVTVNRTTQPDRYEVYMAKLHDRLKPFRLPLAGDDRDIKVDLQTAFTRSYDQGDFAAKIDYQRDPAAVLKPADRQWLDDLLRQQKLR
jgi:hypothetical protein